MQLPGKEESRERAQGDPYTVTGKTVAAAVMVMQAVKTTWLQWPCRTQSSVFHAVGRANVMLISS